MGPTPRHPMRTSTYTNLIHFHPFFPLSSASYALLSNFHSHYTLLVNPPSPSDSFTCFWSTRSKPTSAPPLNTVFRIFHSFIFILLFLFLSLSQSFYPSEFLPLQWRPSSPFSTPFRSELLLLPLQNPSLIAGRPPRRSGGRRSSDGRPSRTTSPVPPPSRSTRPDEWDPDSRPAASRRRRRSCSAWRRWRAPHSMILCTIPRSRRVSPPICRTDQPRIRSTSLLTQWGNVFSKSVLLFLFSFVNRRNDLIWGKKANLSFRINLPLRLPSRSLCRLQNEMQLFCVWLLIDDDWFWTLFSDFTLILYAS